MGFERVEQEMDAAVQRRVFPGGVLLVRQGTRVFYLRAFGLRALEPRTEPMHEDTIFDLSSLTKPLATGMALMLLMRDGKVRLDASLCPGDRNAKAEHSSIRRGNRTWIFQSIYPSRL